MYKLSRCLKGYSTDFRVDSWYWTGNEILIRFSLCELIPANTKWIDREGLQHEDIVRVSLANEWKDGRRRRGRNLWSNQAKSPASTFVLRCLILSKNNIFSRKPLLQYKGREFVLFNRELYPCFLCYISLGYLRATYTMQSLRQTRFMR